ncbi:unnamed protein product [Pylaiella littoralis]
MEFAEERQKEWEGGEDQSAERSPVAEVEKAGTGHDHRSGGQHSAARTYGVFYSIAGSRRDRGTTDRDSGSSSGGSSSSRSSSRGGNGSGGSAAAIGGDGPKETRKGQPSDRDPTMVGEEDEGGARGWSRRTRRAQTDHGDEKGEEGEEEHPGLDGNGSESVEVLAFLVCFGALFCVMEAAKCYFLWECQRRQRWRRRILRDNVRHSQMPIATSRVVVPEVPAAGPKDGWVEVVVNGVSTSVASPGDKDVPSTTGYVVAGASHALREAIEHARRLSPNTSQRVVFASAALPEEREISFDVSEAALGVSDFSSNVSETAPRLSETSLDVSERVPGVL